MKTRNDTETDLVLSIIVPVYNVGDYLLKGLESIAQQYFEQPFEVLLIEDCSSDSSLELCREFVKRPEARNFRLLENPGNLGVSATRNRGLEEARGTYFMFFDPDDLLPPGSLSALYQAAESHQAAIVKGNNTIFNESGEKPASYNVEAPEVIQEGGILTTLYRHEKVRGHPWGKLFRSKSLGQYRFPVGVRMAQDLFYCSEVFSHANSLVLLDQNVYRYRNHVGGSTGRKFDSGSYLDWLDSVENTGRFADLPDQIQAHHNLLLRTLTQLARECRKLSSDQARPVLAEIEQRCRKWNIRLSRFFVGNRINLRVLARYIKMRMALHQVRQHILRSP